MKLYSCCIQDILSYMIPLFFILFFFLEASRTIPSDPEVRLCICSKALVFTNFDYIVSCVTILKNVNALQYLCGVLNFWLKIIIGFYILY